MVLNRTYGASHRCLYFIMTFVAFVAPVISAGANDWETRRLGTTGTVLPNVNVRIMDPANRDRVLPPDTEGEVCVSGPSVMKGYRKNQAANDEVFWTCGKTGEKYFLTGDLGMMLEGKVCNNLCHVSC